MKTGITWEEQNVLHGLQLKDLNSTFGKKKEVLVPLGLVPPMWDPGKNKSLKNLTGKPQIEPVHQENKGASFLSGLLGAQNFPHHAGIVLFTIFIRKSCSADS